MHNIFSILASFLGESNNSMLTNITSDFMLSYHLMVMILKIVYVINVEDCFALVSLAIYIN